MTATAAEFEDLSRRFRDFAERECPGVSPLYEALADAIAEDLETLALANRARPGQPPPNMLFAAVQSLLFSTHGDDPLARFYPSVTPSPAPPTEAYPAFRTFCLDHPAAIETILTERIVSTNEPARAACLLPAFRRAADLLGEPLSLIEIGASAGLLLLGDHYAYDYGAAGRVGSPDAAVRLDCALRGAAPTDFPPARLPHIGARIGLDLFPLDPSDEADRAWLLALIWPEEKERRARLGLTLDLAARVSHEVATADGIAELPDYAPRLSPNGPLCVLHAFTLNQVPRAGRERLEANLQSLARERPVARIAFEWEPDRPAPLVSLTLYRESSKECEEIALADAHGRWLEFL